MKGGGGNHSLKEGERIRSEKLESKGAPKGSYSYEARFLTTRKIRKVEVFNMKCFKNVCRVNVMGRFN